MIILICWNVWNVQQLGKLHYFAYSWRHACVCVCVCVCVNAEIEELVGHTDTKIISDDNLPYLVRQMAVHADVSA